MTKNHLKISIVAFFCLFIKQNQVVAQESVIKCPDILTKAESGNGWVVLADLNQDEADLQGNFPDWYVSVLNTGVPKNSIPNTYTLDAAANGISMDFVADRAQNSDPNNPVFKAEESKIKCTYNIYYPDIEGFGPVLAEVIFTYKGKSEIHTTYDEMKENGWDVPTNPPDDVPYLCSSSPYSNKKDTCLIK